MKKLKLLSLSLLSMMAWTNVMAQKASVTIGTTGYSTTCLSFPAECPNMVTLPTPKGLWTFDDSSSLMAEAGTGVASMTASAGVTANGDGSITVPVGDKLTMATNLAATTIDTYTLMMDIKLFKL